MYDLIVVHDFGQSRTGDRISDPERVAAILANSHHVNFVQKVASTWVEPEPEPAPEPEPDPAPAPAKPALQPPKAPEPTGLNIIKP